MKRKDYDALKKGDFVIHKDFGICYVDGRNEIGLAIRPLEDEGRRFLWACSGVSFNRVLESSLRKFKEKVEKPDLTKKRFFIVETCNDGVSWNIFKWNEQHLGDYKMKDFVTICHDFLEMINNYTEFDEKSFSDNEGA